MTYPHTLSSPRLQLAYVPDVETIGGLGAERCGIYYVRHGAVDIGAVSLTGHARTHGEIGYEIASAFRGQGFATEAVRAVVGGILGWHGFTVVSASARADNLASRRVLEKTGFARVGAKLCWMARHGSPVAVWRYRRVLDALGNAP